METPRTEPCGVAVVFDGASHNVTESFTGAQYASCGAPRHIDLQGTAEVEALIASAGFTAPALYYRAALMRDAS